MKSAFSALLILGISAPAGHSFTAGQSQTLQMLRQEAARDVALGAAGSLTATKQNAGASFDGEKRVPFHVQSPRPVEYIDVPGIHGGLAVTLEKPVQQEQDEAGRRKEAEETGQAIETDKTPDKNGNPSYHFVGKRIPNLNVVTYTPVADEPGNDGSTEAPKKGSDWRTWAPKLMLGGGIAATVAGFFFPPLLFLGGALLGAWGMLKLISAKSGGD